MSQYYTEANQVSSARSGGRPYYLPRPAVVVVAGRKHIIQMGENPYSLAMEVFGDESLWYLIAEANPPRDPMTWEVGEEINVPEVLAAP